MVSVSRRLVFLTAAALLTASGIFTLGIQAERATQTAPSSTISAAVLKALQWRSVGPPRAGRTIAASGVKGRPKEAYFGPTGGGLWKTIDGGATWAPVTDGQINSSSVGAVAVSESNPDVVFIGMGESCIRGNIQPGDGVYKSTDAGKTWTHVGFSDSQAISKIRIHPTNPDIVYVAVVREVRRAERRARRLQEHRRRQDAGRRCCSATTRPAASTSRSIRTIPNVIYAALWEAYRVEYQMSSGGPGSGLFKSTDGGETWTEITRTPGLPTAVDREDRRRGVGRRLEPRLRARRGRERRPVPLRRRGRDVEAGRTTAATSASARSTTRTSPPIRRTRTSSTSLNVGTFRSTDGGKTMVAVRGRRLARPLDRSGRLESRRARATTGGGAVTFNATTPQRTWTDARLSDGAVLPRRRRPRHVPYHVCGAQQDSSTICVPSDTGIGGGGGGGGGGRGGGAGDIQRGRRRARLHRAGSEGSRRLLRRRQQRLVSDAAESPHRRNARSRTRTRACSRASPRARWSSDGSGRTRSSFRTVDPNVLYTSSQHVWRTTNGGQTWEKISPDLTRHDPEDDGRVRRTDHATT